MNNKGVNSEAERKELLKDFRVDGENIPKTVEKALDAHVTNK